MKISLSTSYLQRKFPEDGYAMLCKARDMGFEYVELGHSTPLANVPDILRAVSEGIVKVSSTHNFCPLPPFAFGPSPNLFSPASKSKMESDQWLRHTKNSLDFLTELNANILVCHLGSLRHFFRPLDFKLNNMLDKDNLAEIISSEKYKKLLEKYKTKSAKRSLKQYQYIAENLAQLKDILEEKNIQLGLENRESYTELPLDWNEEALYELLKEYPNCKTWHDTGHSKIKELLGAITQEELLEKTAHRLIGWHLHDCSDKGKDHIGIGKGCIDFRMLSKFFDKQKHTFVLEINGSVPEEDVIYSLKFVQDILG